MIKGLVEQRRNRMFATKIDVFTEIKRTVNDRIPRQLRWALCRVLKDSLEND